MATEEQIQDATDKILHAFRNVEGASFNREDTEEFVRSALKKLEGIGEPRNG